MSYPIVIVEDCQMDKAANEGTTQLKPMEVGVFVDDDEAKNGKVTFLKYRVHPVDRAIRNIINLMRLD